MKFNEYQRKVAERQIALLGDVHREINAWSKDHPNANVREEHAFLLGFVIDHLDTTRDLVSASETEYDAVEAAACWQTAVDLMEGVHTSMAEAAIRQIARKRNRN